MFPAYFHSKDKAFHKVRCARPGGCRRQGGFSYLELVAVIAIIGVLLGIAAQKLLAVQVDAERAGMENVLGALRSALGIKVAGYLASNDIPGLRALEGSNPMDRLSEVPQSYIGVLSDADPAAIEGGRWYFDAASGSLVYRVRNEGYFEGGSPGQARFAVRLVFEDRNRNGVFDQGDGLEGAKIVALEPYTWTN